MPLGCGFDWDCISELCQGCYPGPVLAITEFDNELYVGGGFFEADHKPIEGIAKWNGVTWDSLGDGISGGISTLYVYNDTLYVGGTISMAGSLSVGNIAKWDGNGWSNVHNFSVPNNYSVNAICRYKDDLYVGGNFQGDGYNNIAQWNGTNWENLNNGLLGGLADVSKMVTYEDELYVAGTFSKTENPLNPGNYIAKWNGEEWSEVGGGVAGILGGNGQIHDMIVYNNELYVVGAFSYAGGIPAQYIAKWDGEQWCGINSQFNNVIHSINFFNDTMYLGGGFREIDGDTVNHIAKRIGSGFSDTCGVISSISEAQNQNKQHELNIYPNPNNGTFNVYCELDGMENVEIQVNNIIGQTYYYKAFENQTGNFNQTIDLSNSASGYYIVSVSSGLNRYTTKVTKQ